MTVYIHDGSFDGRLCALAAALSGSQPPDGIVPQTERQIPLFSREVRIPCDGTSARKLIQRIRTGISTETVHHVIYTLLSEIPGMDLPLYAYLREGFVRGKAIDRWHAHSAVKLIHSVSQKVGKEIHRFKGLLRFREMADGTLWAPVEPDYQVLLPLAYHFCRRLPAERGIIHDMRRNLAVGWDADGVDYAGVPENFQTSDNEEAVQKLWQAYFRSATISERINPALQRQCMPARYWKWLIETARPFSKGQDSE